MPRECYIGDSVYAKMEGDMLVIYTDNGDGPRNVIYLEPEVYQNLENFMKGREEN